MVLLKHDCSTRLPYVERDKDAGLWTMDAGIWTLDAGLWTLVAGLCTFDAG